VSLGECTGVIDTLDFVEGTGSLSITGIETSYQGEADLYFGDNPPRDFSAEPFLVFQVKAEDASRPASLRLYGPTWADHMTYDFANQLISGQWVKVVIDTRTPTSIGGSPSLSTVLDLRLILRNSLLPLNWKIDDIRSEAVVVPPTRYTLTINSAIGGVTNPAAGSYLVDENSVVSVTATPLSGYVFKSWELNGVTYTENPISIQMTGDAMLTPFFQEITIPPPPPSGPIPEPGTHVLTVNSSPITGVPLVVERTPATMPYSAALAEGTYILTVPAYVQVGSDYYTFSSWSGGNLDSHDVASPQIFVNLTTDITLTATYVLGSAPSPAAPPQGVLPIPGTPYRWLCARVYGEHFRFDHSRDDATKEATYQKIMQIHPSVIEYMCLCGWLEAPGDGYKYNYAIQSIDFLCARAEQDGLYVMVTWGNINGSGVTDVGLGPAFQMALEGFLQKLQHRPLYIILESEYTKPTNASDIEGTRTELNQVKAICEKYGVRFGIIMGYKSDWLVPFGQEFPLQTGTRYPYGGDTPDGMTDVDAYQYGFASCAGIITAGVEALWTADVVKTVYDWTDKAKKVGVLLFDIYPTMLDPAQCPDFILTVNAEAAARGYVTSLVPPKKFSFTIESSTGGTTDPAAGSYTAPLGSVVAVTATPYQGYVFDHWTLNGVTYTQNPTQVRILANAVLKPYFALA
jgi:hypothetical protein